MDLSTNSRDQRMELSRLLEEETDKVIHHLSAKLPKALLKQLEPMGGLKEKLYDYFNQNYRIIFDRYEETGAVTGYAPPDMRELLDAVGGAGKVVYGRVQGQIPGENAYSIVKCVFTDNRLKPRTVTDVKLAVNIPDSELIRPVFHYQPTVEHLVKDLISKNITDRIDRELDKLQAEQPGEEGGLEGGGLGGRGLPSPGTLFERITGLGAESGPAGIDQKDLQENIKKIVDIEDIRGRGFDRAAGTLVSILDRSALGYQFIENLKNAREFIIREYEDTDENQLPDERYQIRLRYYDDDQLVEGRKAYGAQIRSFEVEFQHLWDLLDVMYRGKKPFFKVSDYEDLAQKERRYIRERKEKTGEPLYEEIPKVWDELSFVRPEETGAERENRAYLYEKEKLRQRMSFLRNRLGEIYGCESPKERRIMEGRLDFLEREFQRFDGTVNPYQIRPGLVVEVDITSIKRKKGTVEAVAGALNEFFEGVFRGFQEAVSASLSRQAAPEAAPKGRAPQKAPPTEAAPKRRRPVASAAKKPAVKKSAVDTKPAGRRGGKSNG